MNAMARNSGSMAVNAIRSARGGEAMKAIEFQSQLNSDQTLTIPPSMRGALTIGQTVRVLMQGNRRGHRIGLFQLDGGRSGGQ